MPPAGRVKLVETSARGREQVLHTEGAGATLGEVLVYCRTTSRT